MKEERRKQMEALIARRQSITMEELCAHFGVSMNTVRADVAYLVESGSAEKIYGGVRARARKQVPVFSSRAKENTDRKRTIARAAQTLVRDGDLLFLDNGTTTMHLLDFLDPGKRVTVVTASLHVITRAAALENVKLIVLPGTLDRRTNSLTDLGTQEFLSRFRFTKAFMGVTEVSGDGRLNVSTYQEFLVKRTALAQSREKILLADGSKFQGSGLMAYGNLGDMTALVTDDTCPPAVSAYWAAEGVEVIVAG